MQRKFYVGLLLSCALGTCFGSAAKADSWQDQGDSLVGSPSFTVVLPAMRQAYTYSPAGVTASSSTILNPKTIGAATIIQSFRHRWVLLDAYGNPSQNPAPLKVSVGVDFAVSATPNQVTQSPAALVSISNVNPLQGQQLGTENGSPTETLNLGTILFPPSIAVTVNYTLAAATGGQASADASTWFVTH